MASGYTRPGRFPVVRVGRTGTAFVEQHEGLHRHFDVLTTIGNAIALLAQGAARWPPPLGSDALHVATCWAEAQSEFVEGVVNYVAHKRAHRRTSEHPPLEAIISPAAVDGWRRWRDRYESLPVSDASKDALAMHVASLVLNMPVYQSLGDIGNLRGADDVVTAELIAQRLAVVEDALSTPSGNVLVRDWDRAMTDPSLERLSHEQRHEREAAAAAAMFRTLLPELASVPRLKVRESIALAQMWNDQARALGVREGAVQIEDVGFVDAVRNVVLAPGAQPARESARCADPGAIVEGLSHDDRRYVLVIVHWQTAPFRLSRKYDRVLDQAHAYIRFCTARVSGDTRIDFGVEHPFAIVPLAEIANWLRGLRHDRVLVTPSHAGELDAAELSRYSGGDTDRLWSVHWGIPADHAVSEVWRGIENVLWTRVVTLSASSTMFWVVKRGDHRWVDVYPLPWDAQDDVVAAALRMPSTRALNGSLLFAGTAMLAAEAF